MIKEITRFFTKNYFGKDLPFDYRIYMIFFMECYVISILSAITNTLLQKGLFGIILQWAYIAVCTVILFIPLTARMKLSRPVLLFTVLFYVPFLYFTTAGYDGTALLFALLGVFLLAVMFHGKLRILLIAINIVICIGCVLVQYFYPALVTPHGTMEAKVADLLVALILSVAGLAILTTYVNNAFETEKSRIRGLLSKLEESNGALAELTNHDVLTGAYNRRFLINFLEKELEATKETRTTVCLLMLDFDNFKAINDTHGHGLGDEVLVASTRVVQSRLRKYDILARYGGEEFVVVLPAITIGEAWVISERIRISVSEIQFRNNVRTTLSIGLVQSCRNETAESIIHRADKCMYQAKSEGRNCIITEKPKENTTDNRARLR